MTIINLTQHDATPDQIAAGVIEPENKNIIKQLLTFADIPTHGEMLDRATLIATIAIRTGTEKAMIGGAPYFMPVLEKTLFAAGITPVYAFSKRESVEKITGTGVTKTAIFRHVGFIEARKNMYEY